MAVNQKEWYIPIFEESGSDEVVVLPIEALHVAV